MYILLNREQYDKPIFDHPKFMVPQIMDDCQIEKQCEKHDDLFGLGLTIHGVHGGSLPFPLILFSWLEQC